jgi:hypothetical protein
VAEAYPVIHIAAEYADTSGFQMLRTSGIEIEELGSMGKFVVLP